MGRPPTKELIPKDNYGSCADTKHIARVDSLFVTEICEKEHSIYLVILQKSLTPNLDLVKASLCSILSWPLTLTLGTECRQRVSCAISATSKRCGMRYVQFWTVLVHE